MKKTMLLLCAASVFSQLSFTSAPTLSRNSGENWQVEFTLSESTDVAVSIVNIGDSTVIRNLAAGVLGSNSPTPLQAGTLHQVLAWDGRDNYGQAVTLPDSVIRARVRAGMNPRLTAFLGDNPYVMASSFHGVRLGPDNAVYVCAANTQDIYGSYVGGNRPIRRFDTEGSYQKTLFPPPADLPLDSVLSYGVNALAGGGWAPTTNVVNYATMTRSLLAGSDEDVQLLPFGENDELLLASDNALQTLRINGAAVPGDTPKPLVPSGAGWDAAGPVFFAPTHDPRYLYLSGKYMDYYLEGGFFSARDTGFWAEGQVFKVEKATGRVTPWLQIDSFPTLKTERRAIIGDDYKYYAALHGVDVDDSGRVFVCNRVNKSICVYDTNAVFLDSVPLNWPDVVSVNRRTNEIYAIARNGKGTTLYKFAGWRGVSAPLCSVSLAVSQYVNNNKPTLVQFEKDGQPMLLIGASSSSYGTPLWLRLYRDDGNAITLVKDFLKAADAYDLINYNRIAVDRRNENVFIQNCNDGLFKITDWSNPAAVRCSTSAGKPMLVDDMAVDPKRGYLYVHEVRPYPGTYAGPITRWTLDRLHAPAPFANSGENMLTPYIQTGDVQGHPSKGMDVSMIDGRVICMSEHVYAGLFLVGEYPDTGSGDSLHCTMLVDPVPGQSGGVKYDLQGNFYIGTKTRAPDHVVPAGYQSDNAYTWGVGSVVKYPAGGSGFTIPESPRNSGTGLPLVKTTTGALKVYSPGYSPFGGGSNMTNCCMCRSPRFDVDYYGRIFIPDAITKQVSVTDNNGNIIARFGKYGNLDSRGGLPGLPSQQTVASSEIPLAYPVSAAASEDFIYVGDMVNYRMLRVRMEYSLDNLPGLTGNLGGSGESMDPPAGRFSLSSTPNPFNPQSRVSVYLPKTTQATLAVYDMSGRLVRTLVSRTLQQGMHHFTWNGEGTASGMYVYRLTAGKRVLNLKTIFAK